MIHITYTNCNCIYYYYICMILPNNNSDIKPTNSHSYPVSVCFMSPLFLIALTTAAKMVRQGHQVDRELILSGVEDDIGMDISGVDNEVDMDTRSENLLGKVAAKVNMPPRFRRYYRSGRFLI